MNMAICWLSAAGGSQNFANHKKSKIDLLHIHTHDSIAKGKIGEGKCLEKVPLERGRGRGGPTLKSKCLKACLLPP